MGSASSADVTQVRVRVAADVELRVRSGGSSPPLVLPHGPLPTHIAWHGVAPLLVAGHTAACPDRRGVRPPPRRRRPPTTRLRPSSVIRTDWTAGLRGGGPIDSGHHRAEDAPDERAVELGRFLAM